MHTAVKPIASLLIHGVHRFATCWSIERTDGVTFYLTDHNTEIVLDGHTYTPMSGPSSSARQKNEGLDRTLNVEVSGYIYASGITDEDLRAGKYRGAKITENVVDWRYPWAGKIQTLVYWIRETTFDRETWTGQCDGLLGRMKNKVGTILNRTCQYTLGDADCQIDLTPLTVSGVVALIPTAKRVITATGFTAAADDFYNDGLLTWNTGNNAGMTSEVKYYVNASNTIEFQLSTPFDIQAGDTFSMSPGCDKNLSTCKDKYHNVINFGGFPTLVGVDKQFATTGTIG